MPRPKARAATAEKSMRDIGWGSSAVLAGYGAGRLFCSAGARIAPETRISIKRRKTSIATRAGNSGALPHLPALKNGLPSLPRRVPEVWRPMNMMANLGRVRLQGMLTAGLEVLRIQQALAARRSNLVAELLHGEDEFFERRHYPAGDIYDPETGAQYYYHAHRSDPREHGPLHIFQRPHVMSERFNAMRHAKPGIGRCAGDPQAGPHWPPGEAALAHTVGVPKLGRRA